MIYVPDCSNAVVLMIVGSVVISFSGLVISNINAADNWQINFYRSLAFGITVPIVLFFRHGKTFPRKIKSIRLSGGWAAVFIDFASISLL